MLFGGKKRQKEPRYVNSVLNNPMLNYRVYVMDPLESVAVRLVCFICGGIVGLLFYGNLFMSNGYPTRATRISNIFFFVVLGLVAMKIFVPMYVQSKAESRRQELGTQFRDFLEALTASFSTGSNVMDAFHAAFEDLRHQYDQNEYIVKEVEEIVSALDQGFTADVLLKDFAARSGEEDIESFADVFEVCYRTGGNMTSVIDRTRTVIVEKAEVMEEVKTTLTSNKLQHNVMSVMPIALMAMLRLTNDAFAENFATPIGVIANTIALVLFICAYRYGQKIVDIKV